MININRIELIDDLTTLEIKEYAQTATVTLLHRGERIHSSECAAHLLPQVIEAHREVYGDDEEEARQALDPEDIAFEEARQNGYEEEK